MGKKKKAKKWHESDDFIPAPKQERSVDLTGFLIQGIEGKAEALDPANKAAVVLAQVINDPEVRNVVTVGQAGLPEGLEVYDPKTHTAVLRTTLRTYDPKTHKAVHKSLNTYDPQVERAIPKSWAAHDVDTYRTIPKELSTYNPTKEKVVAKGLGTHDSRIERPVPNNLETYNPETHRPMAKYLKGYNPESDALISKDEQNRYRAAVQRLQQASSRSLTRSGQLASEVLDLLGEMPIKPSVDYLEGPGWRELDKRAKEFIHGVSDVSPQPVSQEPLPAGEHRELLKQNNELLTKVLAALEAPKGQTMTMQPDPDLDLVDVDIPGDIRLAFVRKFGPVADELTSEQKKWLREQCEKRGLI